MKKEKKTTTSSVQELKRLRQRVAQLERVESERKRAEKLADTQHDLALAMNAAVRLDEALRLCVEAAIDISGLDCGGIYLVDQKTGALDLVFHKGLPAKFVKCASHYDADSPNARLVMAGQPVYSQYDKLGMHPDKTRSSEGLCAIAIIPVQHEGQVIACINISSHTLDEVPAFARHALETTSAQIGGVIARVKAEKALRVEKAYLEQLFESSPEAVAVVDNDSLVLRVNSEFSRMFGYTLDETLGRSIDELLAPKDLRKEACSLTKRVVRGKGVALESKRQRKDGTLVDVSILGTPIKVSGGQIAVYAIYRDITERKRAEQALRESEAHYHSIFNSATDALLIFDVEGNIVETNPQACKMYGYSYDELIKLSGKDIVHPDHGHLFKQFKRDVQTTGEFHAESVDVHKDGTPFNIEVRGSAFDYVGKPHLLAVIRDITERKQAETTQRVLHQIANAVHTTKDLNELFNTIRQDLGVILNTENFFIALYDRKSDTFTLPYIEDEKDTFDTFPAGKTLTAYVVKHDKPLLATDEDMEKLVQSGEVETIGASSKIWLGVPLKAGKEIIGALVVQSYTDETAYDEKDLQILKFVSSQIGLSIERKRAQEALREERDKAQTYLDVAGTIFVAIDADQKVRLVNKKGCEILGYKEEKIIGKNWFDNFLPEAVRDEVKSVFTKLMAGEVEPVEYFENPVLTKSGQKRIIAWHNTILKDETGTTLGVLSSGEDITERKQAEEALRKSEEQLRQSQKMEAVGRLAGGVAHDLNNLLTGVTGYSDLLSVKIGEDGPQRRYVTEIQKATSRAVSLIHQLLAFSRKQMLQPKVMNLNDAVADMEKMLQRVIGEDIELVTVLDPALRAVKADPGQMGQIIMNLAVNARDAMPQGGKLTIETANVDLDEEYVRLHTGAQPGSYVMLTVSDTGDGMDEQTCSRIFEPFFTTKQLGKGTGLGLSTVYGIVKQSGGNIWVYSEPGQGTTFRIYLPRIEKNIAASKSTRTPPGLQRGTETILVVEDEELVRKLLQEILQKCGYSVLVARHGDEALSLCQQHQEPIHLLVTDVVMPHMNGRQLAERLALQRPEIKILYISGYTDNVVVHGGLLEPGRAFLQKPFTSDALARKVRRVLDIPVRKKRRSHQ